MNLKELRLDKGIKAIKVAELLGISRVQLNNLERGKFKVSEDKIVKLSDIYRIPKYELLNVIDETYKLRK